jgi:hypothetical protein
MTINTNITSINGVVFTSIIGSASPLLDPTFIPIVQYSSKLFAKGT